MVDTATAELEVDVRRTIRAGYRHSNFTAPDAFLTSSTSFLTPYDGIQARQKPKSNLIRPALNCTFSQLSRSPLMTQEEEDYLVEQYTKSGFKNSLQFYQYKVVSFLIIL